MVTVTLISTNANTQEAVVQMGGIMYVTELIYLEHIRDNLYFINSAYLAPMDTCSWCI